MQTLDYCERASAFIESLLDGGEASACWFSGEESTFARFNHARIRQIGHVHQLDVFVDLSRGEQHARGQLGICGEWSVDQPALQNLVTRLREQYQHLPPDPYYRHAGPAAPIHLDDVVPYRVEDMVDELLGKASDLDLVGILSCGPMLRAYAGSSGVRHWYRRANFLLDFSAHLPDGRAVKKRYSDQTWDGATLERLLQSLRHELAILSRKPVRLSPGSYRTYLAPTALTELFALLSGSGFSCKAQRSLTSPLTQLAQGNRQLAAGVSLSENHAQGVGPQFTPEGAVIPERVALIEHGHSAGNLIDSRSAAEFSLAVNAANEETASLDMAPGSMELSAIGTALGKGLMINNLWYTNFSDWNECRITGMTRYAAFWAEDGVAVAPIETMRFDDSFYRMFGEGLIGLTAEREFLIDAHSYERRSTGSYRLPGALIEDFRLTL